MAIALVRGISRKESKTLGNFWVDTTRASSVGAAAWVHHLCAAACLPGSGAEPAALRSGKAVAAADGNDDGGGWEGCDAEVTTQSIAQGPVASQEAIKMLGTNGGGFFNANSAHPFENPTPLSNLMEMFSIFLIPAALTVTLGTNDGVAAAWLGGLCCDGGAVLCWRLRGVLRGGAVESAAARGESACFRGATGGNMEGKEVRFGIANSALFATVTTDASCGAVNSMHDSFMPLGGLVPMLNIMLGEVIFGGVGAGLYGMLIFVVLTVFIAGLMVGRTPEYLGKKIESYDVKMAMLYVLIFPLSILGFSRGLAHDAEARSLRH